MGPKGKSKAVLNQAKQAREIRTLTVSINKMNVKIESLKAELELLTTEFTNLTSCVNLKKLEVDNLKTQVLEFQGTLSNLNQINVLLTKKVQSQQQLIRRKQKVPF